MMQVLIIALAISGAVAGFQTWRVATLKTDLVEIQGKYALLGQKVEEQNAAVIKWEEAASARSKTGQIARAKAQAEVAKGAAEVARLNDRLWNSLKPLSPGEAAKDCKTAVDDVRKGLAG